MDHFRSYLAEARTFVSGLIDRRILVFGEEGYLLVNIRARHLTIDARGSWEAEDAVERLEAAIKRRGRGTIILIADMLEQFFRAEALPPVPFLDRTRVRNRKLALAFENNPHRGHLWQFRRDGRAGETLLMASLGAHELVDSVFAILNRCQCEAVALGLLAVEAGQALNRLLPRRLPRGQALPEWRVLIARYGVSGLRQLVMRENDLVLTRLRRYRTDGPIPTEAIAQEFKSTITYLSRLGFKPDSRLVVMLIGADRETDELARQGFPVEQWIAAESDEMLEAANVRVAPGDRPTPAEIGSLATVLEHGRIRMPMSLGGRPQQAAIRIARLASAGAAAALVTMAAWAMITGLTLWEQRMQLNALRNVEASRTAELANLERQLDAFDYTADDLVTSLRIYADIRSERPDLLPILERLAERLGPNLRLALVSTELRAPTPREADLSDAAAFSTTTIEIEFTGEADLQREIAATEGLADRLRAAFEGYRVVIRARPLGASISDLFSGEVSAREGEGEPAVIESNEPRRAVITLDGPARLTGGDAG